MAGSKRNKIVRQKEIPGKRQIVQIENPDRYYKEHPAWNFNACDTEMWAFTEECVGDAFWTEVLPFFKNLETQTWNDVLVVAKKNNHSIDVSQLNSAAQKRLADRYIEQDSLISLRLSGTHRIYGYIEGRVFNILWYDNNHGNNETCVCRSTLKHT